MLSFKVRALIQRIHANSRAFRVNPVKNPNTTLSPSVAAVTLSVTTIIGAALRLHLLAAKSLWIDEAASANFAVMRWPTFLRTLWGYQGNMALYYLLLRAWVHLGASEFAVRNLSPCSSAFSPFPRFTSWVRAYSTGQRGWRPRSCGASIVFTSIGRRRLADTATVTGGSSRSEAICSTASSPATTTPVIPSLGPKAPNTCNESLRPPRTIRLFTPESLAVAEPNESKPIL